MKSNSIWTDFDSTHNYEWIFDPLTQISKRSAIQNTMRPVMASYKRQLFSKRTTCKFGCLDYLKKEIPYGVVLKMSECKELRLFNCFHVMAPLDCWRKNEPIIDPIIVATIVKEFVNFDIEVSHYFLAQW